ncbi:phage tail tape measure protein [Acinetobacter venetianus]|uniref:phage tail tape measure protein n=1 Tax=Acinetobacter venetianus TaxID=52133 RepID=UPI0021502E4A|nr:phage tail tape measure protein [Acinetobacter venetianus]MCR4529856.1 phage tail tape measure protein [Acinetobacter venetianus]
MSNSNSTVSLTLQIKGQQAGQEMKKISDQQISATKQINQQWTQIGSAQAKFVATAKTGTQATVQTARASDGLLRTNRMMEGVLRQQSIQTRIQSQQFKQQQATVQRLTGLMQQQQQSAQQLARWMKQVENSSKQTHQETKQTFSLWRQGAALAAGVTAGGAIVSSAMQKPRDYDQQLTYITNTATAGQGMTSSERILSRGVLNEYIKQAIRSGGGTREDAADAANTLIASGKYELKNVAPALNVAVRTAFATGASATDAANLTVRMADFGVTDLQKGHDIAVKGDQYGAFGYKDQAKWLAQQMAAAKAVGYSGEKGLIELVALNQIAMKTAATTDEAGNNLVNLLAKLSSREFSKSVSDVVQVQSGDPTKSDGKKKPKQVFDWSTYAIQQRDQGVYGVEAFIGLLERQLMGNKQYQKLQAQALSAKTPESRKSTLEDMTNIAMGSQLGEFIADRQALMAALSAVYNKDSLQAIRNGLSNAAGTVDSESEVVKASEWAKDMAMNQEKLFAQSKAYDAVSDSLSKVKDKVVDWAQHNEDLAGAAYTATVGVTALGAAAGITALGIGGKSLLTGSATSAATGGASAAAGGVVKTAGVAAAGYLGFELFKPLDDFFYGKIAGLFGASEDRPDFVQMAIDKSQEQKEVLEKQNQLIEKQNQLSSDMVNKLNSLISATQQNKPVINMGGSLMDQISQHARNEEKRHGVDLLSFGQK